VGSRSRPIRSTTRPRTQLVAHKRLLPGLETNFNIFALTYVLLVIVVYTTVMFLTLHKLMTRPVGAMVARSPPKAEAVGSSPTSVVFLLFLAAFMFSTILFAPSNIVSSHHLKGQLLRVMH
jgi:hypothetical protein